MGVISVNIRDEDLLRWMDTVIKEKRLFRNKSHLVEVALRELRKKIEGKTYEGIDF